MTSSEGDPRVLLVMNLVLSAMFATMVIYGLSLVVEVNFGWRNVAMGTLALMVLTWLVVLR